MKDWLATIIEPPIEIKPGGSYVTFETSSERLEYLEVIDRRADGEPLHPRQRSGWRCDCARCLEAR